MNSNDGLHRDDIVDVSGKSSRQRRMQFIFVLAAVALTSACLWAIFHWYGKPRLNEYRVSAALTALAATSEDWNKWVIQVKALPREQMLLDTFDSLSNPSKELEEAVRVKGARAALDSAVAEGSDEARLILGKALRDGTFGTKDSVAALREFDGVRASNDPGVRAGDPNALYIHALMLAEGLGINQDLEASAATARRAAEGINGSRLKKLAKEALWGSGVFKGRKDPRSAARMAQRLIGNGDHSAFRIGVASCNLLHEVIFDFQKASVGLEAIERRNGCREPWIKNAAVAGYKPAMGDYAMMLLAEQGNVELAIQWFKAAGTERSHADSYHLGLVKATSAADLNALASGVKVMWTALKEGKKSEYPTTFTSFNDVLDLIGLMSKVVAKPETYTRRNFVIALLALGELEGAAPEAMKAMQANVGMDFLRVLARSSEIHRTAFLVAEAVRANKLLGEVTQTQPSGKMVPFSGKLDPQKHRDPEQQARTGYLAGTENAASSGLSTFTVDNASGERDAIVRLYLNGKKPAVRNFYVKLGEKFTAKSIAPGIYAMRYRFVGSDDTFEADAPFALTETATESGRRVSNVTVTLYKVRDGNMNTKKVSSAEF